MPEKSIFLKIFRNLKHVFNNAEVLDLEHVRSLTTEESRLNMQVVKCKQSGILT
jgi:hypothetical protein